MEMHPRPRRTDGRAVNGDIARFALASFVDFPMVRMLFHDGIDYPVSYFRSQTP